VLRSRPPSHTHTLIRVISMHENSWISLFLFSLSLFLGV
jgi:hypothetical protein